MNKELDDLLMVAIETSIKAGKEILKVYLSNFNVEYKDDQSPITQADLKSNAVIIQCLKPLGINLLSEEGRNIPYDERKNWNTFWMVDPLDGTKEFIKRN